MLAARASPTENAIGWLFCIILQGRRQLCKCASLIISLVGECAQQKGDRVDLTFAARCFGREQSRDWTAAGRILFVRSPFRQTLRDFNFRALILYPKSNAFSIPTFFSSSFSFFAKSDLSSESSLDLLCAFAQFFLSPPYRHVGY